MNVMGREEKVRVDTNDVLTISQKNIYCTKLQKIEDVSTNSVAKDTYATQVKLAENGNDILEDGRNLNSKKYVITAKQTLVTNESEVDRESLLSVREREKADEQTSSNFTTDKEVEDAFDEIFKSSGLTTSEEVEAAFDEVFKSSGLTTSEEVELAFDKIFMLEY
ncbi:MAG: hypothetical protein AB3P07_06265 [Wolbachia pipientis]